MHGTPVIPSSVATIPHIGPTNKARERARPIADRMVSENPVTVVSPVWQGLSLQWFLEKRNRLSDHLTLS